MTKRYQFCLLADLTNDHGQVFLPKGTSGVATILADKIELACASIPVGQYTAWFTLNKKDLKNCDLTKIQDEEFILS